MELGLGVEQLAGRMGVDARQVRRIERGEANLTFDTLTGLATGLDRRPSDLLAAVGLWLAAAWGGVLWLFSACAGIIITLFMPDFQSGGLVMVLVNLVLIFAYFILTWNAAQERD
jgi:transcriptional regulator with XRE-family HTH domain